MSDYSSNTPKISPDNGVNTPGEGASTNTHLQWLIKTVSELKTSHERLSGNFEHKFECLETKITARNESLDERMETRHKATEDKISHNHELMMTKMQNVELKIQNSIADSRFSGLKWLIPLLINLPALAWMVIQVVKAVTSK